MNHDSQLNLFAIRCFRDLADEDYIAARMTCRAMLVTQFLWASQQAIEKYLKCILLLNRIPAPSVKHDLKKALNKVETSGKLTLTLTPASTEFLNRLNDSGQFRYLEFPNHAFGTELVALDRIVWELRRFCTTSDRERQIVFVEGQPPPLVKMRESGPVEAIIKDRKHPARSALLWQNGYFGNRRRSTVRLRKWFRATNPPLSHVPAMVDEVLKYVYLPKEVAEYYRARV